MHLLVSWLLLSLSVLIVTRLMSSVQIRSNGTALIVALVYGLLKLILTKVLVLLTLPLMILSFGLFYVIINAFLLWLTDKLIDGFEIHGFFSTLFASVLISVIDTLLRWIVPGV